MQIAKKAINRKMEPAIIRFIMLNLRYKNKLANKE